MRYFLRKDNGVTQIDETTNPSYLKYALEHYNEISKSEYDSLMPKDEFIDAAAPTEDDYTDLSYLYDDVVESPTNDIEPKVEEVIEEKPINPHRL